MAIRKRLEIVLQEKGLFKEEFNESEEKDLINTLKQYVYFLRRYKEVKVLQEHNLVKLAAIYAPYGSFSDPKKEKRLHKNSSELKHIYNALKNEGFLVVEDDRPIFKPKKATKDGKYRFLREEELPHDISLKQEIPANYPTLLKVALLCRKVRECLEDKDKLHLFTNQPITRFQMWYQHVSKQEKLLPKEFTATLADLYLASVSADSFGNLKYWIERWYRIASSRAKDESMPSPYSNIAKKELMEEWIQIKKEFPILRIPN